MALQTYWLKKDGSDWKFYSNSACTTEVTNHTFNSPHGQTTSYAFKIEESGFKFYASEPLIWLSYNEANITPSPALVNNDKDYSFDDDNDYAHEEDKGCLFDLQLIDNNAPTEPFTIFSSVQDVDPTILEKGEPIG